MSITDFLAELRLRDVEIWLDGETVRCNAPKGVLTPELRERLRNRRNDIREFLRSAQLLSRQQSSIVPLQGRGRRAPVFAVPGHNGDVFTYCELAQALGRDQPFFGLQPPGLIGLSQSLTSVEGLASYFASQIQAFQPQGKCVIAGFCAGGSVAFELAQELQRRGGNVSFVALFGCPYPTYFRFPVRPVHQFVQRAKHGIRLAVALASHSSKERRLGVIDAQPGKLRSEAEPDPAVIELRIRRAQLERATIQAVSRYRPVRFNGRVCLLLPSRQWARSAFSALRWQSVAEQTEEYFGPQGCDGDNMLLEPNVHTFAEFFRRCSEEVGLIQPCISENENGKEEANHTAWAGKMNAA